MTDKSAIDPGRTKARTFYASLDALRGLAAFAVVFFHLGNWTNSYNWVPRGDLAVDFFFCLSGFVMAHAYGRRIGKDLNFLDFAWTRLIRLYPLMALSVVIAAAYFLSKIILSNEDVALGDIVTASVLGLLVLPYLGETIVLSGPLEVFPINGPLWSLFYELLINFAWAAAFAILTFRRMVGFAIICAGLLLAAGLAHGDLLLGDRTSDFFWGIPRVGVSFAAGLIVYALHKKSIIPFRVPFWAVALALMIPLLIPRGTDANLSVILDALFIYGWTPFLVLLAAGIHQSGRGLSLSRIGGELSYPIYVLHFPLFAWSNGITQFLDIPAPIWVLISLHLAIIVCGSWLALIAFDRPVRRLLNSRRTKRKCSVTGQLS